jgi:DNA-binding transcriptional LysR family regulator
MPRPPSISPELMITFVTIVRTEGDATYASEILKINQPSMSKRLAFLQHAGRILRKPWIERIGKTWHLTEEGRRVLPAVEELVHRYRLLTESLEEDRPAVVFGTGSGTAINLAREAMKAFREKNPDLFVRITARSAKARIEGVSNGSLDLACVRLAEQDILDIAHRPLHVEELYDETMVLAAIEGVPGLEEFYSVTDKTIPPKSLTKFPLILPEPDSGLRRDFDRRCRDASVLDRLRIAVEAGPWTSLLQYVKDGFGVGLLPRSAIGNAEGLVVKALPPKLAPPNVIRVIARRQAGSENLDLNPTTGYAFLECLRSVAKSQQV